MALCVNCDHPLPPGAAACPGCGASRLELLVTPATEPSLARPRRRRRGWGIVALLLCAAIVVALAGQANQSSTGTSASKAPSHGKPKVATHRQPPPTTTEPAPGPDLVRVALGPVPDSVPDPEAVLSAARAAMQSWSSQNADLQEASAGDADVSVQFVADAADAGDSSQGVAVVPLGDSLCGGTWSAYDSGSVQALAARALGQAMGRSGPAGPGDLMDPEAKPRYATGCVAGQGSFTIGRGQADGKSFRLGAAATVSYTTHLEDGYADVCIVTPAEWDAFAGGVGGGEACHYSSQSQSDSATLEPGDYILGFRCVAASPACHIDFTVAARAA